MNWYCIHTKPRREQTVAAYLAERLEVEPYFPRLRQKKVLRRVKRLVLGPLFPRYLFCRFDLSLQYRAVRYSPDVIDVVSFGGRPAVVADSLIADLRGWAGDAVDIISLQPELRPGDHVEITAGPMRGLPGVILEAKRDSDRVAVLLSILECGAKMIIDRAHLASATAVS